MGIFVDQINIQTVNLKRFNIMLPTLKRHILEARADL